MPHVRPAFGIRVSDFLTLQTLKLKTLTAVPLSSERGERQSKPDSGLGFQVKSLTRSELLPHRNVGTKATGDLRSSFGFQNSGFVFVVVVWGSGFGVWSLEFGV